MSLDPDRLSIIAEGDTGWEPSGDGKGMNYTYDGALIALRTHKDMLVITNFQGPVTITHKIPLSVIAEAIQRGTNTT